MSKMKVLRLKIKACTINYLTSFEKIIKHFEESNGTLKLSVSLFMSNC